MEASGDRPHILRKRVAICKPRWRQSDRNPTVHGSFQLIGGFRRPMPTENPYDQPTDRSQSIVTANACVGGNCLFRRNLPPWRPALVSGASRDQRPGPTFTWRALMHTASGRRLGRLHGSLKLGDFFDPSDQVLTPKWRQGNVRMPLHGPPWRELEAGSGWKCHR